MRAIDMLRRARHATGQSLAVFVRDVGQGLLEVGHNALALLGLAVVAVLVFAIGRDDLRAQAEKAAYEWLQTRHGGVTVAAAEEAQAAAEAEAAAKAEPPQLTREQNAVAKWIARRYKVAPEPIATLVREAWNVGQRAGLDPTLILAIVAVESSFNPFAQSPMGAQGLMQVMTKIHDAKYTPFGGQRAALDPISNLQVGVQVLKECIARAGGLQEGLRHYVGAALSDGDGGYVGRVLAEQSVLRRVADGNRVPVNIDTRQREAPPPAAEQVALAD